MIDNYEREAVRLLSKLGLEDSEIPVKIYTLADKMNLMVLINTSEDAKKKVPKSTIIEKGVMNYIFEGKIPWGDSKYYLLLADENPIDRRMLTACAIAQIVDEPNLAVCPIMNSVRSGDNVYRLALSVLIPLVDITDFLRKYNFSISDAIKSEWMIETLSTEFFVYKIDMVNRLKMMGELVDAE